LEDALSAIEIFDLDAGKAQRFATLNDRLTNELKWAADSSGLFTVYSQAGPNFERAQIGFFSRDGGGLQPITRDTNSYSTLTLSADGKTLATVQVKTTQSLYLVPGTGSQAAVISPLLPQGEYVSGFGWTDRAAGARKLSAGGA